MALFGKLVFLSLNRETKMISNYYDDLLDIIEICLKYSLNNTTITSNTNSNPSITTKNSNSNSETSDLTNINNVNNNTNSFQQKSSQNTTSIRFIDDKTNSNLSNPNTQQNNTTSSNNRNPYSTNVVSTPAHANIVSDILSCILLDYLDDDLSAKAIPVCIKILHHHNAKRELIREIVSYLNLVACRSPELLVDYVYYLASGMLKGYPGLAGLLYQIAESHVECIYPLVKHFVRGLKLIESVNDFNYVMQIMYLVSLSHVQVWFQNGFIYLIIMKKYYRVKKYTQKVN